MPAANITLDRQRDLIQRVSVLAARRAQEGAACDGRDAERIAAARRQYQQQREAAVADFQQQHAAQIAEYKAAREAVFARYEAEGFSLAKDEQRSSTQAAHELAESIAAAKTLRQHRTHEILRAYREQKVVPKNEYAAFKQQCQATAGELHALVIKAQDVVRRRGTWPDNLPPPAPPVAGLSRQQYMDEFSAAMGRAFELLIAMQNQPAARFVEDGWLILVFLAAIPATGLLVWFLLPPIAAVVASAVAALIVTIAARQIALPYARRQTLGLVPPFQEAIGEAQANLTAAVEAAKRAASQARRQLVERRNADLTAAKTEFHQARKELSARHRTRAAKAEEGFSARRKAIEDKYEKRLDYTDEKWPQQIESMECDFTRTMDALRDELRGQRTGSRAERDRDLHELTAAWSAAVAELDEAAREMNEWCDRHFAGWEAIDGAPRRPADAIQALRFGHYDFEISIGDEPATGRERASYKLPAVLSYPERPSLLIQAEGEGRQAATQAMQSVMLRLLTTFPPGKVRFTIIDPVGLGQNFSAFMHLADYDEKLVASRIWTEATHINQRLADLTEHMENVIQKYLRNEFASIQEYNQHAGEVAEPFQILVVANFPANFPDEAARRLAAIATSGPRCGVYTLISTDGKLALPRNFSLADLEAQSATLVWDAGARRLCWQDEPLRSLPLTLESPPDDERFTQIVRGVGKLAKDAARVEVPFEMVTPPVSQWWTADSRGGIEVPLGRSGAKNLQSMRLGRGTSQHVLISGKTGSGKSTLLNAMITNLATHYSPGELEFYLIDFKKGVEFKAYAAQKLPHARVIAIESEREFGMSVLERLDQELKQRGDLFRKAGVQDLKGYRNATESTGDTPAGTVRTGEKPVPPMPRILLIIDEFQEFFTSDDRIAHDAALLLDRLVRQGRAFGIHVLLGSQTLAGAYTLARSTLGQMAVRIALQCSEADAHLILSEDNTAARLLGRPGEAIYNDANGLVEGNHPFQVVWLPDSEREDYLRRVAELARQRQVAAPPTIVFEGNAAADMTENDLLQHAIDTVPAGDPIHTVRAWLGSAVAIKDPTDAVFRPQGGSSLLIVGQQEELALGILSSSVISLAAQLPPIHGLASLVAPAQESPARLKRFYVLDGTRPDAAEAGFWSRVTGLSPFDVTVAGMRDAGRVVGELTGEVNRRLASSDQATAEPVFLVIYNLARFRDLKKADDYSFGDDGAGDAGKQLTTILREGPAVGVHVLIWCDSYNNVNRWLDRQALRDLEMRVLLQMSATDSSNLMDSPAASRLSTHTAIFYSEEHGQAEKFRPYGVPTVQWLAAVSERLAARLVGEVGTKV